MWWFAIGAEYTGAPCAGTLRLDHVVLMHNAGFFAKHIEPRPEFLHAPGVREICSVSRCISSGPENWIDHWLHNDLGWFNRMADALRTIPPAQELRYRLFAYRIFPEVFTVGGCVPFTAPDNVRPEPIPAEFRSLGFDSVSKSMETVLGFECSPLSCNGMAAEIRDQGSGRGENQSAGTTPEP